MPAYVSLRNIEDLAERGRVIDKLLALRAQLDREIPAKTATDTLLLATWNIRSFGDNRTEESLRYIAEIASRFDLIAIQEVASEMEGLKKLVALMGHHSWDYIVTDVTEGGAGNGERLAFVYNTNKVFFRNMAGELVLPKDKLIKEELQFARTPFTVAFQAGWFKFILTTVHILYKSAKKEDPWRVAEIDTVAEFLNKRAEKERKRKEDESYILLGDFNIFNQGDATMKALEQHSFHIPDAIKEHPTDLGGTKYYDQIAFKLKIDPKMTVFSEGNQQAGSFDFTKTVYLPEDMDYYKHLFPEKTVKNMTQQKIEEYYLGSWRTFQMSDHLPLWIELKIDFSNQYLERVKKEKR
ncbi:MAG: endonuclease/exonuclease/phosphatase family protein [Coriobacteriales bacterium]|jgi:endonuclease/exonuclease/phosphatase family metal-dependent hydrolase|nr:endonuclease/exonuclease/phosphatase family protein [Coriobacteriales bacterium]